MNMLLDEEFETWLPKQPREVCSALAVRAALRVFPLLSYDFLTTPSKQRDLNERTILGFFRVAIVALAASRYPNKISNLIPIAASANKGFDDLSIGNPTFVITDAVISSATSALDCMIFDQFSNDALEATSFAREAIKLFDSSGNSAAELQLSFQTSTAADMINLPGGKDTLTLSKLRLWNDSTPQRITDAWATLSVKLRSKDKKWAMWTKWYDAVLEGELSPGGEELDIFRIELPDDVWEEGPDIVNALIAAKEVEITSRNSGQIASQVFDDYVVEELEGTDFSQASVTEDAIEGSISKTKTTVDELAKYSSPQPTLTFDGKLDVQPNAEFDVLVASQDLPTLPIRQLRLIDVILSDLPQQAPGHLKSSLVHYGDELKARGINPFLGILKDMAEIIAAASAVNDGEWLQAGLRKSFELFNSNHIVFIEHFPLDIEREKRFTEIEVYEDAIVGDDFVRPFKEAEVAAKAADFVTADTIIIMERMRELAEITAYMPPAHGGYLNPKNIVPLSNDRFAGPTVRLSVKKRLILQARGFWSACVKVLAPIGNAIEFLDKLRKLIEIIYKFFPDGH